MLNQKVLDQKIDLSNECWKTRISYVEGIDTVHIEHFGENDKLLSELFMDYEGAYAYAKMIVEVADRVLGVD